MSLFETPTEVWLVDTVARQAKAAGIGMPEVAVYESDEVNAFATGMSRNSALVAVSTGLLQRMTRDEVQAVLGHEVSHVANGDMVTLALIQGIVWAKFFSTHPALEDRISALRANGAGRQLAH